ncbi:hypothetical protein D9V32_05780 [Mycetocola tolaasinivorans]|uniref:Prepilin type IV endopeptidase peptidase domain-containing protein n=1 Tax=Mycetocola tolaasinivorans TaxID=76635 RepID=A0A3L7A7R9_9MICO|nr:hypothetical protein D9V32_05780 [Mycetocola tolaasinivorans]
MLPASTLPGLSSPSPLSGCLSVISPALWPVVAWLALCTPLLIRTDLRERRLPNALVLPAALLLGLGMVGWVLLGPTALPLLLPAIESVVGTELCAVEPSVPRVLVVLTLALCALALTTAGMWGGGDGKLSAVLLALLMLGPDPSAALLVFGLLLACGTLAAAGMRSAPAVLRSPRYPHERRRARGPPRSGAPTRAARSNGVASVGALGALSSPPLGVPSSLALGPPLLVAFWGTLAILPVLPTLLTTQIVAAGTP